MTRNSAEYLERVVELEKSLFMQDQAIKKIKEQMDTLGKRNFCPEPERPAEYTENIFDGAGSCLGMGGIIGLIVGMFCGSVMSGIIWGGIIGFVFAIGSHIYCIESENSGRRKRYDQEMAQYSRAVAADKKRVEQELVEARRLKDLLAVMDETRKDTRRTLDAYYGKNIIFPKYRNMIAMCSFYEYYISGRCTQLEGHEGAYNIFESEIRLDRIYTTLEQVVQKLQEIKSNQYVLYNAIQEGNNISRRLYEEAIYQSRVLEDISESAKISAEYSQIAAKNAEACAWIGVANYMQLNSLRESVN